MARLKKGLDFFYFDTSFYDDIKIRKLIRYHGAQAVVVYQLILIRIYAEGYYLNWDDDILFVVAESSHLQDDYVKSVFDYCFEIGLFDKQLFEERKVVTSRGVQNRFFDFCVVSKRKVAADSPYLLVDLSAKSVRISKVPNNSELNLFNDDIIPNYSEQSPENTEKSDIIPNDSEKEGDNSDFGTQSKVKKSKVKNNNPLTPLEGESDESDPVPGSGDILSADSPSADEDPMRVNNPVGYETMDLSFVDENFRKVFFQFLEYKRVDHRFKFKSVVSLKTCYNRLVRFAENDPQKAALIVETCISNGWKGFFEEKNVVAYGNVKQPTAKERINAEFARGADHLQRLLASNEASLHEGVQEKVW